MARPARRPPGRERPRIPARGGGVTAGKADAPPGHSWVPVNLATVEPSIASEPDFSGILYAGARHLLSGEPDDGKSLFAAHLALERVRANRVVLWLDFEQFGDSAMQERLRCFGATNDELARLPYIAPTEPFGTAGV